MDILRQPALGRTAELGTRYNIEQARFLRNSEKLKFSHQASVGQQRGTYFQVVYNDMMCEKFFRFGVSPELQLHILGRVLEIKGSGSYLHAEKNSVRAVRVGLLCTVKTKTVGLKVTHPEFLKCILKMKHSSELVSPNNYAVTEIDYGGRIVVSVEDCNEDERDISKVTQELATLLESLVKVFEGGKPLNQVDFPHAKKLSWTAYSDFVDHAVTCSTMQEVCYQFENLMQSLKFQPGGQGIPIHYTMINLQQCLNIAYLPLFHNYSLIQATKAIVKSFDHMSMIKHYVGGVYDDVRENEQCVTKEDFDFTNNLVNKCQESHTEMWEAVANALLGANNEVSSFLDAIINLQQAFEAIVNHSPNFNLRLQHLQRIHENIKLVGVMMKKGVKYCNTQDSYMELRNNSNSDCYILHCRINARFLQRNFQDNWDEFLKMIDDKSHGIKSALFVFADYDFDTNASVSYKARIEHVKKGEVISEDMLTDRMTNDKTVGKNDDKCLANCSVRGQVKSSYSGSSSSGKQCIDVSISAVDEVTEIKKSSGIQKPGFNENANKKAKDKASSAVKAVANTRNENISYVKDPSIGNADGKMRSSEEEGKQKNLAIKSEQRPHPQEKEHKRSSEWEVVPSKPKRNAGRDISKTSVRRANSEKSSIIYKRNDNRCMQRNVSQAAQPRKKEVTVLEQPKRDRETSLERQPRSDRNTSYKSPNAEVPKSGLAKKYQCPPSEQFEDAKVKIIDDSSKTINILIMGESGVGKSTWINGVANYINYSTVEEAARSKAVYVINSSFLLTDDDYKEIVVRMGPEGDGKAKLGTSATQFPQSYTFTVGGKDVRLIDTPGIGDTRGVDKDQENFRNIFSHLSQYRNIHGICILLKPNSARMNTSFQFCIKELLAHLHTDACKNIVFVFTNSRGTFYRPGDTFPTLSNLLKENKGMDILLENERVYCMDNEPVRFLAATKQGMEFNDRDKANYANSWEVSRAETVRLIDYISNLEPHAVEQSLHLNEVMKFSMKTAEHFVAFAKGLRVEIGRHRKHLYEVKKIENEQRLPSKMIVCCNTQCKRACHQDGNSVKYSSVCHHPCRNKYIQPNGQVGNKDIKECDVMDIDNGNCSECGCKWLMHMCIINKEVGAECHRESRSVKNQSTTAEDKVPSEVDRELVRLKTKLQFILQNGAKLGIFLKQNAIGTSRDLIMEQLERTIEKEQELTALGEDVKGFKALTKVMALYISEARNLEKEMLENHQSISFSELRQVFKHHW